MNEADLGRRLQAARIEARLTQQALCQRAELSYSTLTKIERGAIKAPSIFTIQSIANALGLGLDELMGVASASRQTLRSKSGVGFVYFDINGCLVDFFQSAFTRLAGVSGAPPDVVETAFWHYNDNVCRGDMTVHEFNQAFAREIGLESLDWQQYYFEAISPITGMHELVRWVATRYRVGLLTNIMPGFIQIMRERKLLPDVSYDVIVDSSVTRAIKPEAKMYEIAAERASCPTHEILLVDDSRANLMAAEKQGWHVLWFNDYRPHESIANVRAALQPANVNSTL